MKTGTLILLRHGECQGGDILRGQVDVALSAKGEQQMKSAIADIDCSNVLVYSSPLIRCMEFALQLDDKSVVMPSLQETDFGDWDGLPFETLLKSFPMQLTKYWDDPWENTPPNGETLADFGTRVTAALTQIIDDLFNDQSQQSGKTTAMVITHAGVIRHIVATVLHMRQHHGLYRNFDLPYAAKIEIKVIEEESGRRHLRLQWPNN
ncbi:MAG: histidine phosphatase family protein [Parashewanella sp.]